MIFANPGGAARTSLNVAPGAVWLDMLEPTDAEREQAAQAVGFAIPGRSEMEEIESSSRVSRVGDVLYLNTPIAYRDADGLPATAPVGFALSGSRLVTVRYVEMKVFDHYADTFAATTSPCSAEALTGLIEVLVDRLADVLESVAADLERLSRQTFRSGAEQRRGSIKRVTRDLRATLRGIGLCGGMIDDARDSLLGIARIVGFVQQAGAAFTPDEIRQRLVTSRQDVASLNDYDQQLTAKTSFLLDAVLGFINIDQNDVVRVLTVASVVGIPPTFVVGLYGMNFKSMPEYDWPHGYAFGWGVIIVSVLVPIVWLRVKGRF